MNNIGIWILLIIVSLVFGILTKIDIDSSSKRPIHWFFETWRHFVGYLLASIIGYFFIDVRWPYIHQSGELTTNDFLLFIAFLFAVFGWWPYVVKNITEGIEKILAKIIK
jgi:hypothetical protein